MICRRLTAALAAVAVLAVPTLAAGAPAVAATDSPLARLTVAPQDDGVLQAKRPLDVSVAITNPGSSPLAAGHLAFSLDKAPVASTATLLGGISQPQSDLGGYLVTGDGVPTPLDVPTPAVPAGATAVVRARIPAARVAEIVSDADGARLLYVRLRTSTGVQRIQAVGEAAVVRMGTSAPKVGFGTVIPITAPPGATGLVDVDQQGALTADGGDWASALDAARAMPAATIALDPAVLASIRLAGESAPGSATAFLAALRDLPDPVVRLPYADADLTLERAAGASTALAPTSFAGSTVASTAAQGSTPAPSPSATTTATDAAPTVGDLTAWSWSSTTVSWPVPGTVGTRDLSALTARGPVLLSGSDVGDTAQRAAAGPLATVGGRRALIADGTVSPLLAAATGDGIAGEAARSSLTGVLATDAVSRAAPVVLAVAGRGVEPAALARVLGDLAGRSWIRGAALPSLVGQQDPVAVTLRAKAPAATSAATARVLMAGERAVQRLGRAITDAEELTGPRRLALLGLLSAGWRGRDADWDAATGTTSTDFATFTRQVSIVPGVATVGGADGRLPVVVQNRLPNTVTVDVTAAVSNGRLQFAGDRSVRIRVPPDAHNSGPIAFRSINNGPAKITLTLAAPDGTPIGESTTVDVTVNAGVDTIVAVVLLVALGLLLALGIYRNVRRRHRPRTLERRA